MAIRMLALHHRYCTKAICVGLTSATQLACGRIGTVAIGDRSPCDIEKKSYHVHVCKATGHTRGSRGAHYDAAVVGLGAFGSSVLYHLAKAGLKVIGIERHHPVGHALGSSHGASRIIRLAYFEGLQYGPLLKRSYRLFHELQQELEDIQGPLAQPLFLRTGMLDVGSVFPAALSSALVHGLQHEVLTGEQLNRRFPAYRVPEHWRALYQPDGGVLAPERILQAYVSLAQRHGASVLTGHSVTSWRADRTHGSSSVTLTLAPTPSSEAAVSGGTESQEEVTAAAVVMAPGPWIGQLVPELKELCIPERQVVAWFEIDDSARSLFAPDRFPVFLLEEQPGGAAYYGFPEHGDQAGFKIGLYRHLRQEIRDPAGLDTVRRPHDNADEAALRAGVASYFPAAGRGRLLSSSTCFFTNTPDGHFLVDTHPRHPQVILCSACSGHGFKMSSGIGQLIFRMVQAIGSGSNGGSALQRHADSIMGTAVAEPGGSGVGPAASGLEVGAIVGKTCGAVVDSYGWGELMPFRFDVLRPGHDDALARFASRGA